MTMIRDEDIIEMDAPPATTAVRLYLPEIIRGMVTTLRHMFRRKITVQYPEQTLARPILRYRGVHRLNRDEQGRVACVACFMCSTICPARCIHIEAAEAPWPDREKYPVTFDIDELRCIYCGLCEYSCPVDAIELTPEHEVVGRTRDELVYDKEKLLEMYDRTRHLKPRRNPPITGYPNTGPGGGSPAGTPPAPPNPRAEGGPDRASAAPEEHTAR